MLKKLSFSFLDSIAVFLGTFIFRILIIRNFSPSEYGVFVIIWAIFDFFNVLVYGFSDRGAMRLFVRNKRIEILSFLFIYRLTLFFIIFLINSIFGEKILSIFNGNFKKDYLIIFSFVYLTGFFRVLSRSLFENLIKFKILFFHNLFYYIILNTLIFFQIINNSLTVYNLLKTILIAEVIGSIEGLFLMFIFLNRDIKLSFNMKRFLFYSKEIVNYGRYSMGIGFSMMFYTQIDSLVIGSFLTTREVGIYDVGKKLLPIARLFSNSLSKYLFPVVAKERDLKKVRDFYFKMLKLGVGLGSILALFNFIFSKYIVLTLFGNDYISAIGIVKFFSLYFILHPIINLSGNTLGGLNYPKYDFYNLLITMSVNFILDITLIKYFGLWGVAFATLFSVFLGGMLNFYRVNQITTRRIKLG